MLLRLLRLNVTVSIAPCVRIVVALKGFVRGGEEATRWDDILRNSRPRLYGR